MRARHLPIFALLIAAGTASPAAPVTPESGAPSYFDTIDVGVLYDRAE